MRKPTCVVLVFICLATIPPTHSWFFKSPPNSFSQPGIGNEGDDNPLTQNNGGFGLFQSGLSAASRIKNELSERSGLKLDFSSFFKPFFNKQTLHRNDHRDGHQALMESPAPSAFPASPSGTFSSLSSSFNSISGAPNGLFNRAQKSSYQEPLNSNSQLPASTEKHSFDSGIVSNTLIPSVKDISSQSLPQVVDVNSATTSSSGTPTPEITIPTPSKITDISTTVSGNGISSTNILTPNTSIATIRGLTTNSQLPQVSVAPITSTISVEPPSENNTSLNTPPTVHILSTKLAENSTQPNNTSTIAPPIRRSTRFFVIKDPPSTQKPEIKRSNTTNRNLLRKRIRGAALNPKLLASQQLNSNLSPLNNIQSQGEIIAAQEVAHEKEEISKSVSEAEEKAKEDISKVEEEIQHTPGELSPHGVSGTTKVITTANISRIRRRRRKLKRKKRRRVRRRMIKKLKRVLDHMEDQ